MVRVAGRSYSRDEVARAAWRVIVRDGLHRASIRAIARELGATTGAVTYHFEHKAELLLFALDRLGSAIVRDIEEATRGATGLERVRRILATTMPLGPREVAGWRIWVSFVSLAMSNRRLREEHQRRLEILSDRLATELAMLKETSQLAPDVDPRKEADALIALTDGIGLGHLLRPRVYPADRQWEIVDRYLQARLGKGKAGRRRARAAG